MYGRSRPDVIEALSEQNADAEPSKVAELRQRFGDKTDAFAVILVGKDGGEKLRSRDVPDLDAVFSWIDGMPIRQRKIREQEDKRR